MCEVCAIIQTGMGSADRDHRWTRPCARRQYIIHGRDNPEAPTRERSTRGHTPSTGAAADGAAPTQSAEARGARCPETSAANTERIQSR